MSGALRTRIALLAPTREADGAGGAALSWTIHETLWADVERLSGGIVTAGEQRRVRRRRRAIVRRREIAPGLRARIENVDYDIVAVESASEKASRISILCEEVLP